ncbi:hypothetical protein CcrBL47_gp300 [Caulobacter phage BL47]|nr:hypothetical protein CcrBL47_gp300 [Caulobacter phage BL47]
MPRIFFDPVSLDDVAELGYRAQFYGRDGVRSYGTTTRPASDGEAGERWDAKTVTKTIEKAYKSLMDAVGDYPGGTIRQRAPAAREAFLYGAPTYRGSPIGFIDIHGQDREFIRHRHLAWDGVPVQVVPKQMLETTVSDMRWVRPRCPNKRLEGRKGTRKAWKRANPPGWRAVGPPKLQRFYVMHNGILYLTDEQVEQIKAVEARGRVLDVRLNDDRGITVATISREKLQHVERIESSLGHGVSSELGTQTYVEEEVRPLRSRAEADELMEAFLTGRLDR